MLEGFSIATMGRSTNGWVDSELFATWLTEVFVPGLNETKVKRPTVLLVDGHSTHLTLKASDICRENGIILYCLLAHASHIMQHLELRFFSSLKGTWRQAVRDYQFENVGEYVTKRVFASVFRKTWGKSTTDISVKPSKMQDCSH